MKKWEDFEGTERHRKPQFSLYFENQYFHDLRNKTFSSVVQQLDEDPYSQCYGKIYWYFSVVVIRNIFIRKFSHLTIPSPFISVNQKMYKNHSSFCYSLSSYAPACRHFCYLLLVFLGKYKC